MRMEDRIAKSPALTELTAWMETQGGVTAAEASKILAKGLSGWMQEIRELRYEIPPELDEPKFVEAWADWIAYMRTEKGLTIGPVSCRRQLDMLGRVGVTNAVAVLERAMANGWKSFDFLLDDIAAANKEAGLTAATPVMANDPRITSILGGA